LELLAR